VKTEADIAGRWPSPNGHGQSSDVAPEVLIPAAAVESLPRASWRIAALGAAVTILIALVVLGSRPSAESQTDARTNTAAANAITDVITVMMMIATVAGAAILAYVFWPTRRRRKKGDEEFELYVEPQRIHWAVKLAFAVLPFLLLAGMIYAVYTIRIGTSTPATPAPIVGPLAPLAPTQAAQPGPATPAPAAGGADWVAIAAAAALIAAAVAAGVWAVRRRSSPLTWPAAPPEPAAPTLSEDLAAALDESLEDLRRERDPRRAVIAAYARMERIFARHGLPRRRVETPYEYAARVLQELGLGAGAVRGLTHLFELARFSHHEIGASMQEEAVAALVAIRQEL
jgi:hypothetical protein